jgi:hypothetical protein
MQKANYNDSVFINCPFDSQYLPILRGITYTIYRCGFFPRTAMDEDNASDARLEKIMRMIKECRYGIHDLSRTEAGNHGLPRFNMPFELGIFFGAKYLGGKIHGTKNALIFERTKYSYQRYISDINGMDTKAHHNRVSTAMEKVRDWLRVSSRRAAIPGYRVIHAEYAAFKRSLPAIVAEIGFGLDQLPFMDYQKIVEEEIRLRNPR